MLCQAPSRAPPAVPIHGLGIAPFAHTSHIFPIRCFLLSKNPDLVVMHTHPPSFFLQSEFVYSDVFHCFKNIEVKNVF